MVTRKMFDLLTKPGSKNLNHRNKLSPIEPHVTTLGMRTHVVERFAVPFEWVTYCLSTMILSALLCWMWLGSTLLIEGALWTLALIAPFYFTGLLYYLRYYSREQDTRLEIDHKHQLIQYKSRHRNLLFHFDQVTHCAVTVSTFLPYRLEYTSLRLCGDIDIHISNLIVDPEDMVAMFEVPYEVRRRLFNSMPVK